MDKVCSLCGVAQPEASFFFRKDRGKRENQCRACKTKRSREWRKANPERRKTTTRRHYGKYREYRKYLHIRKTYGLSEEQYKAMLEAQGGLCKICKKVGKKLHVDHCHRTGLIRGILCNYCNVMLGQAFDRISTLAAAHRYIVEAYAKQTKG